MISGRIARGLASIDQQGKSFDCAAGERMPRRARRDRHRNNLLQRLTCYSFRNRPRRCRRKLAWNYGKSGELGCPTFGRALCVL